MCQAITQPDGGLVAVLEILRRDDEDSFHEEDEEIAYSYLVWGGEKFVNLFYFWIIKIYCLT